MFGLFHVGLVSSFVVKWYVFLCLFLFNNLFFCFFVFLPYQWHMDLCNQSCYGNSYTWHCSEISRFVTFAFNFASKSTHTFGFFKKDSGNFHVTCMTFYDSRCMGKVRSFMQHHGLSRATTYMGKVRSFMQHHGLLRATTYTGKVRSFMQHHGLSRATTYTGKVRSFMQHHGLSRATTYAGKVHLCNTMVCWEPQHIRERFVHSCNTMVCWEPQYIRERFVHSFNTMGLCRPMMYGKGLFIHATSWSLEIHDMRERFVHSYTMGLLRPTMYGKVSFIHTILWVSADPQCTENIRWLTTKVKV